MLEPVMSVDDTNVYKTITLGSESTYAETINFNLQLSGTVDQTSPMMSTTSFTRGGVACSLEDEPISGDTEKRNIFISYYYNRVIDVF